MTGLTQHRLKELLRYDPDTGEFVWLVTRGKAFPGAIAGCVLCKHKGGLNPYWAIRVDGSLYQNAARLAWLYMTGEFPAQQVDHKNGDTFDNSWANLRLATPSQNLANRGKTRRNSSGKKGVVYIPEKKKWRAGIGFGGKHRYLGYFNDAESAHAAYCNAAEKYYGEFARQS